GAGTRSRWANAATRVATATSRTTISTLRMPPAPPLRSGEPLPTRLPGAPRTHSTENPAAVPSSRPRSPKSPCHAQHAETFPDACQGHERGPVREGLAVHVACRAGRRSCSPCRPADGARTARRAESRACCREQPMSSPGYSSRPPGPGSRTPAAGRRGRLHRGCGRALVPGFGTILGRRAWPFPASAASPPPRLGARLGLAYLLDGRPGELAAQPGGHRAVGELALARPVVPDDHGGCTPGAGCVG